MRHWIEQGERVYVVKPTQQDVVTLIGGNGPATGEAWLCHKDHRGVWRKPVVVAGREGRVVRLAQPM